MSRKVEEDLNSGLHWLPKQGEGSSTSNVQQSLSANMKVKVKMRQADMPAGVV